MWIRKIVGKSIVDMMSENGIKLKTGLKTNQQEILYNQYRKVYT